MKETLASLWNGQFSVCREVTNNKEAEELNRLIQKHYQDLRQHRTIHGCRLDHATTCTFSVTLHKFPVFKENLQ